MRRVVVTPTFAAGLGVVVAAVLAYPMQTVFNYAAPNERQCGISCGDSTQAGGEPASVPGKRLSQPGTPGTPASGKRPASGAQTGRRSGTGDADRHAQVSVPQLSYQTSGKGRWGFDGTIMIAFRHRSPHGNWWLRFGYPSARILKVWAGGRVLEHGAHNAAVASWDWPGNGSLVRVSIGVAGHAGPPHRCSFNGRPCHIIEHRSQ